MKPFEHPFKPNSFGIVDTQAIFGYLEALKAFLAHVTEATKGHPLKRYIDSVEILERISATSKELEPILKKEHEEVKKINQNF